MRILLRKRSEGLYFKCPFQWTDNPDLGFDFKFIDHALKYVQIWGIKGVELAFAFDDDEQVTAVPLAKAALRYAIAA